MKIEGEKPYENPKTGKHENSLEKSDIGESEIYGNDPALSDIKIKLPDRVFLSDPTCQIVKDVCIDDNALKSVHDLKSSFVGRRSVGETEFCPNSNNTGEKEQETVDSALKSVHDLKASFVDRKKLEQNVAGEIVPDEGENFSDDDALKSVQELKSSAIDRSFNRNVIGDVVSDEGAKFSPFDTTEEKEQGTDGSSLKSMQDLKSGLVDRRSDQNVIGEIVLDEEETFSPNNNNDDDDTGEKEHEVDQSALRSMQDLRSSLVDRRSDRNVIGEIVLDEKMSLKELFYSQDRAEGRGRKNSDLNGQNDQKEGDERETIIDQDPTKDCYELPASIAVPGEHPDDSPTTDDASKSVPAEKVSPNCEIAPREREEKEKHEQEQEQEIQEIPVTDRKSFGAEVNYNYRESLMTSVGSTSNSGHIQYSGSISMRSESSTTSARSFAFPILQTEWNSSPIKMAKANRRRYRKHCGWRTSLLCCRF